MSIVQEIAGRAALSTVCLLMLPLGISAAQEAAREASRPAPACASPSELRQFHHPLRHAAQRLANGEALTIVAIGSSSTNGAGASSAAASYPSRLAAELRARFPGQDIVVLNRGVNGEETEQTVARFAADVAAAHPDIVLWQVGTNPVLRDRPLEAHAGTLRAGLALLKETAADVVLIDMQYAPRVLAKDEAEAMEQQIAFAAKEKDVGLFRRYAIMRDWHEAQHLPFETFLSADQLHMNDWGYACVAKLLAQTIGDAIARPAAAARLGR